MAKKLKRVQLVWHDAYSTDEWTNLEDLDVDPMVVTSLGYLVTATKETVVVAGTVGQGQACCVIHVPRRMVVSMKYLD